MAQWGKTDAAGSSPIWAPATVRKAPTRANANLMFGNTTANAYGDGLTTSVVGVDALELAGGGIASITVDAPGSGALTRPNVAITTGTATATATAIVVSASSNNAGNGYAPADTLHVTGGTGVNAAFVVAKTKVSTAVISAAATSKGSGYVNGDIIAVNNGGTGTQATANVTTNGTGNVSSIVLLTGGSYTVNPTLLVNAATANVTGVGTGAKIDITMGVANLTISNTGNYTVLPVINAAATSADTGTGGTTATLALSFGVGPVTITANGSAFKYTQAPAVQFVADGLGGASAHSNLAIFGVQAGIAHTGWVKRTVGTGGRAGRVQTEVLVAGSITTDASDDSVLPE